MFVLSKCLIFFSAFALCTGIFCYYSWYCYDNIIDSYCNVMCKFCNNNMCWGYDPDFNHPYYTFEISYTLNYNGKNFTRTEPGTYRDYEICTTPIIYCGFNKHNPNDFKFQKKDLLIGPVFALMFIQMAIASFMPLPIYYFILYITNIIFPNIGAYNLKINKSNV